jgi:hypothetical protein
MTSPWCLAWFCLAAAGSALTLAEAPIELSGESLPAIPTKRATYRVREIHTKTGGPLPGKYTFDCSLNLCIGARELKHHPEQYEGTPLVPLVLQIADFRYTGIRAGGERHEVNSRSVRLSGPRGWAGGDQGYRGLWDIRQERFKISEGNYLGSRPTPRSVHLAGVWVPALVVMFPETLKVEQGFSWGRQPPEAPRRLEQLCYLQQWTVAGIEKVDDGFRLTLAAEYKAEPDERGRRSMLKRQVVYDTARKLVVRAKVEFEAREEERSEKVHLVMELEEAQQKAHASEPMPRDRQRRGEDAS